MGIFCIAHSATYERLDSENTRKMVYVDLDLPFELLDRAPTAFEKEQAESNSIEARRYHGGNYPKVGDRPQIERAILLFHIAALYGEPTACALMGDFYEYGRYGVIPNLERAALCRKNVGWWDVSPKMAAAYARAKAKAATALAAKGALKQASVKSGEGLHRRGVASSRH